MSSLALSETYTEEAIRRLVDSLLLRSIALPTPTVGTNFTQTVPSGAYWEIVSVFGRFATSAVVANRIPSLQIIDGDGTETARYLPPAQHVAGNSLLYTFSSGVGVGINNVHQLAPLPSPPIIVPSGWVVRSVVTNIDVGDQWSTVVYTVREFSAYQFSLYADRVLSELGSFVA